MKRARCSNRRDSTLAEWLVEEGIGEHRAIQLEGERIIAARLHWPGGLTLGQIEDVVAVDLKTGAWRKNGVVRFANGELAFASRLPRETTEGATVRVEVTRESLAERGRLKLAQATHCEGELKDAPSLAEQLASEGHTASIVPHFPQAADWDELWGEASSGDVEFPGGGLILSDTPAMTLIDVDLRDYPEALFFNGLPVLARTLSRLNIAGNIGIDFPTLDKTGRKVVDERLSELLADWPHERTAMNGFGFVQIIARMGQPSLLQRISRHRTGAAARMALRRAELAKGTGRVLLLTVHPALKAKLKADWLDELARRTGKDVRVETNPALALEGANAQLVES
jgi:hypothetical protein